MNGNKTPETPYFVIKPKIVAGVLPNLVHTTILMIFATYTHYLHCFVSYLNHSHLFFGFQFSQFYLL